MHLRFTLIAVLAGSLLQSWTSAGGQSVTSNSWDKVLAVSSGTQLVIVGAHRLSCTFISATEEAVQCEKFRPIARARIDEIRYAKVGKATEAGALIGAAAGVGLSAAAGGSAAQVIAGTGLGAIVGGFCGRFYGLRNGPLIYRK